MAVTDRLAVVPPNGRERPVPDRLTVVDCLRIVLQAEPQRPVGGHLEGR